MPPARLEPTIPTSDQPQTYALNRAATGIGEEISWPIIIIIIILITNTNRQDHPR
jgi:hypothetical protein